MLLCRAQFKRNKGSQAPVLDELQKYFKDPQGICVCVMVAHNYYNAAKMLQFPLSLLTSLLHQKSQLLNDLWVPRNQYINIRLPGVVPTRGYNDPTWLSPKPLPSDFSQPSGGLKSQWKAESEGFFSAFLAIKCLELHDIHLSRKSGPKDSLEAASCCICRSCCTLLGCLWLSSS